MTEGGVSPLHVVLLEYYRTGANKTLRFGQFFYNRYIHDGKPWPELFYERDMNKAVAMVADWYASQEVQGG